MPARDGPSCEGCKARKVRCSREWPVCRSCLRHGRQCRRERFPLSWPTKSDPRRLFVASGGRCAQSCYRHGDNMSLHFVNASHEDVTRFIHQDQGYYWSIGTTFDTGASMYTKPSFLPQQKAVTENASLVPYFYNVSCMALPRLDSRYSVRDIAVRLSLQNDSPSSLAVLYSLLHISAVHRYGDTVQAAEFKNLALQSLRQASQSTPMDRTSTVQHLLASLFLCRAAISLSAPSPDWVLHIAGAKKLLASLAQDDLGDLTRDIEGVAAYQCLHYHYLLSRFSMQHWHEGGKARDRRIIKAAGLRAGLFSVEGFQQLPISNVLLPELRLFDDVLDVLYTVETRGFSERLNNERIIRLYDDLRAAYKATRPECLPEDSPDTIDSEDSLPSTRSSTPSPTSTPYKPKNAEAKLDSIRTSLCLASIRIYLDRSLRPRSHTSTETEELLDDAYTMLKYNLQHSDIRAWRRLTPFTLLLIGAEARDDEERRIMLDTIAQSREESERWLRSDGHDIPAIGLRSTAMMFAKELLEKIWLWDDLHESMPGQTDYKIRLDETMSSFATLPALL